MRGVRLSYYDHDEEFAKLLPREGELVREVESSHGVSWWLLRLDKPLEYKVGAIAAAVRDSVPQKQGDVLRTDLLLIRSHWVGYNVGDPEKGAVNILLVDKPSYLDADRIDFAQCFHVAWGFCENVAA